MFTKHMLITKNGYNDYEVWFTDDLEDVDDGYIERGSEAEIKEVVRKAMLTVKDLEKELVRHGWVEQYIGIWVYPEDMEIGFVIDTNTEIGTKYEYDCVEPDIWSNDYQELIK